MTRTALVLWPVLGLFCPVPGTEPPPVHAPPIATPPGHYSTKPVTVRLSVPVNTDSCGGARILYTDDGTDPRVSATAKVYRDSIRIADEMSIIKAYAKPVDSLCAPGGLMVETYIRIEPLPEPVCTPDSGTIEPWERVTLRVPGYEDISDVRIYYTTGGADPVTHGVLYEKPLRLAGAATVRAVAVSSIGFFLNSPVMSRNFTVAERPLPPPVADPPSTNFDTFVTVELRVPGAVRDSGMWIRYTLDHGDPDSGGIRYDRPIRLATTASLKAVTVASDGRTSRITEELYSRGPDPVVLKPRASPPGGEYGGGIPPIRLSCGTEGARICYTLDGAEPSMADALYDGTPVVLETGAVLKAAAFKVDHIPSVPIEERYTLARLPEPVPSLASGTVVADTQSVTVTVPGYEADTTVRIRWALHGEGPGEGGAPYTGPIRVVGNTVLKAQAYGKGYRPGPVATIEYYAFAHVVDAVYRDTDGDGSIETAIVRFDRRIETIPGVIELSDPLQGETRTVARDAIHLAGCREETGDCGTSVALITVEPPFPARERGGGALYGTIAIPGHPEPYRFTLRPESPKAQVR